MVSSRIILMHRLHEFFISATIGITRANKLKSEIIVLRIKSKGIALNIKHKIVPYRSQATFMRFRNDLLGS